MKKITPILLMLMVLAIGCKGPEARRPVSAKSGTFMKNSIERNKELLEFEEKQIAEITQKDSLNTYITSANGYSFYYVQKDTTEGYLPREGDLVRITYDLRTLEEDTIYSSKEIGTIDFRIDKEEYFPGLRTAVKLLRKGEKATFYFPSSLAYGYHGDDDRIGTNIPLVSTISLIDIIEKTEDTTPSKTP
ncbi:gliding motility-associated peptidyl-prolyl isomerase GldI [Robertkochia aurantiaca]|uniref:gliding motility-associated peptidyl-prolyl isomerase GldI n=1 Tax=Robertkochia aurantiaca TaxID=2873700 RepID=UPI001CCDB964|nr:gliding motility-associated peptidyl-prolyl isomerase GldI [Robertkochia sp. 3YJGBD-33]